MAAATTNRVALVFIVICLTTGDAARVSRDEYLKLKKLLKSLNRSAVTSIKAADEDIFYCVHTYKQRSSDHPLLENHEIQIRPTSFPKNVVSKTTSEMKDVRSNATSEMAMMVGLTDEGCPRGTVPIARFVEIQVAKEEDSQGRENWSSRKNTQLSNWNSARMEGDAASVSREEFLELRRQLKSLNKPAVRSIKTVHDDIFDCVDIYKQPAFDHPLLKDHKIQMRPTSFPKRLDSNNTSEMAMKVGLTDGGCPQGTVPIRRIRMRDLLRVRSLSKLKKTAINDVTTNHHWVSVQTREGEYNGARAHMNVWNPSVGREQFSLGQFWIEAGEPGNYNTVEAGWTVDPTIYGDHHPRLFVYWTADNYNSTGCYNTLCPGFVQISRDVAPGSPVRPVSTYNGEQRYVVLQAFKDVRTKNWWVTFGEFNNEKLLGYFPKSLFKSLVDRASGVRWGGEVFSPGKDRQPEMGSGHFPNEGFRKAAFMRMIMTVDDKNTLRDAPRNTYTVIDEPNCYNVDDANQFGDDDWRRFFYFGGPGC